MDYSADVERTLRELAADAQERAQQAEREADIFRNALAAYLTRFGRAPQPDEAVPDPGVVRRMKDATYRQMVRIWGDAHGGRIVAKHLTSAAFATGRFESRTKAHRTMWSALSQAAKKGEIRHVGEGEYERADSPKLITDGLEDELQRLLDPADSVNRPAHPSDIRAVIA